MTGDEFGKKVEERDKMRVERGVAFEADVFLLRKVTAQALKSGIIPTPTTELPPPAPIPTPVVQPGGPSSAPSTPTIETKTVRLIGVVPREVWNRLGTRVLPKLQAGSDLKIGVDFSVSVRADLAASMQAELRQILQDLELGDKVQIKAE